MPALRHEREQWFDGKCCSDVDWFALVVQVGCEVEIHFEAVHFSSPRAEIYPALDVVRDRAARVFDLPFRVREECAEIFDAHGTVRQLIAPLFSRARLRTWHAEAKQRRRSTLRYLLPFTWHLKLGDHRIQCSFLPGLAQYAVDEVPYRDRDQDDERHRYEPPDPRPIPPWRC